MVVVIFWWFLVRLWCCFEMVLRFIDLCFDLFCGWCMYLVSLIKWCFIRLFCSWDWLWYWWLMRCLEWFYWWFWIVRVLEWVFYVLGVCVVVVVEFFVCFGLVWVGYFGVFKFCFLEFGFWIFVYLICWWILKYFWSVCKLVDLVGMC